jgi:hypothetical protein
VKRYVREEATDSVRRLLDHELRATVRTSESEVASALARREREGCLSQAEMMGALAALRRDLGALLVVEVTAAVVATSVELLQRHPLRAGDALQLAAALELGRRLRLPLLFVAFDQRLLAAAKAEKLKTAPE